MFKQTKSHYQSYLLRFWRVDNEETWRLMLEHVGTHRRQGFADPEALCAFLREQMDKEAGVDEGHDHSDDRYGNEGPL